jgi:hypothetical protein
MGRRVQVAVLAAVLLGLASEAGAIPRYAARYRQNCTLCHQNPAGGGLRSLYASQFIVPNEMALTKLAAEKVERIHPDLSPSVVAGADLRTAHFRTDSELRPERNFFQMQADVYLSFSVDDRIAAILNVDRVASTEIYGLAWVLPWSGYLKAGRFTPVFGWKHADHNMLSREELGFDQPDNTDAGLELGVYPKRVALWASVLNGEPGSNPRFDRNDNLAYVGGALVHFSVARLGMALGGSILRNENEPGSVGRTRRTAGGPFGYAAVGPLIWLWEVDASRRTTPGAASKTALVTAHEVSWHLRPGLDVLATYGFVDRDLDRVSGTRSRWGLGVEVIPVPFVELQANVSIYDAHPGADVSEPDFVRSEIQLHLFL